jgi:hypothetical protein
METITMKPKREKGYWLKKKETYSTGTKAQTRAGHLRSHEHVSHVKVDKHDDEYIVAYSVAKWYVAELEKAGIVL